MNQAGQRMTTEKPLYVTDAKMAHFIENSRELLCDSAAVGQLCSFRDEIHRNLVFDPATATHTPSNLSLSSLNFYEWSRRARCTPRYSFVSTISHHKQGPLQLDGLSKPHAPGQLQ